VAAAFRTRIALIGPWLVVLLLELVNEWNDLQVERWPSLGQQLGEGAKDLALTMLLPTLLLMLARWRPGLFARR
jgi:diacylglycerol kinase